MLEELQLRPTTVHVFPRQIAVRKVELTDDGVGPERRSPVDPLIVGGADPALVVGGYSVRQRRQVGAGLVKNSVAAGTTGQNLRGGGGLVSVSRVGGQVALEGGPPHHGIEVGGRRHRLVAPDAR